MAFFFLKLGLQNILDHHYLAMTLVAYHTIRTDTKYEGIPTYIKNVYKSRKLNHCSGIYNSFEACTIEPNISANFCIAVLDI